MKIHIEKIVLINRAPFDKLNIDFNENEIAVLTAINGSGKTTLLSHIVDAWYEMAKPHFPSEFEDRNNKYYRVSSPIYNLVQHQPSFVYIRFKSAEGNFDYVDIRNNCSEEEYNEAIQIENKIPFNLIKPNLDKSNNIKLTSSNFKKENAERMFYNNLVTYFPAYRYEAPGYLNEPYKVNLDFTKLSGFSGYLNNPLEVITGLPQLANWIMDIVLDMRMNQQSLPEITLFQNLNNIISQTLISKNLGPVRFGIGPRRLGSTRIQIIKNADNSQVYPTIFNLSSGESSILCLFGELLKQADNNQNNIKLDTITGIVLIDEVDKHLHIKLQKEVLPKLFKLFPNVQFILSSHSPFLSMGLAEEVKERTRIVDLDNLGISSDPKTNELYSEVYNMMINENKRFKEKFDSLNTIIQSNNIPLIITEGKTDAQHIKKAYEKLNIQNCEVEFYEIVGDWGDSKLKILLEQLSKVKQTRKVIGIFDRDDSSIVSDIEDSGQLFKDFSNNVYGVCIPLTNEEKYGTFISIEHYYPEEILLKLDSNDRRLFLGKEFYESGNSIDGIYQTKTNKIQHKVKVNGVIDEKIYKREDLEQKSSIALTKANFADLIETNIEFVGDFDFNSFSLIFDRIKEILVTE
ncbi:AAA family ATPase [Flavobacterium sp. SM2513]|uniref:AAA family ATPase n=1 Tax=Flavobacterium sp. SM2513 TaxID=3424766 RepID=UPI003D7F8B7F